VSVEPVTIDEKGKEAILKVMSKEAPAFNGPVKVVVRDTVANTERTARFSLVSRSENNGVPGGYSKLLVEETEAIWLTVKAAKDE
jgi:hypothetical protein